VNAAAPGWIATSMSKDEYAWLALAQGKTEREAMERIRKLIPQGREGVAQDIANVVYFLVSPLGSYVAGETIRVDGAYHLTDAIWGAPEE
jgi:NAD(P)-dependent dehydrogenase (short-subunit alcohol dehydrogenase family)